MQAVILSRVSSLEQTKGFSNEAQTDNCIVYAKQNKFEIVHVSEVDESASYISKKGKRAKLWECIEIVKKLNKQTNSRVALICDMVDRLQRGYREFGTLEEMLESDILELHFVSDDLMVNKDNLYDEPGKRWRDLANDSFNHVYRIRKHAKKGMKKLREKNIVVSVPEGYIRKNKEVTLASSADLITEAFELFATGRYSQTELCQHLNKKGFKTKRGKALSRQTLHKILRSTFYYGLAQSKYGNYQHIYKPLTTKAIFNKCQAIINKESKSSRKQKRGIRPYTFRNLLTCSSCGRTINPDGPKKGKYIYYRCINSKCPYYQKNIKEEVLLKRAEEIIEGLRFTDEAVKFIVSKLKDEFNQESLYQKQRRKTLYKEIETYEGRRSRLMDLLVDGSITKDDYTQKQQEYESKLYELNLELTKETRNTSELHLSVSSLFNLVNRLPEVFQSSNTAQKNQILKYLVSNSTQSGTKASLVLKKPFSFLYKNSESKYWFGDRESNPD